MDLDVFSGFLDQQNLTQDALLAWFYASTILPVGIS